MSAEAIKETTFQGKVIVDPYTPVPPTDLIFDDGEPLESNRHRIAMNALIRSMLVALPERNDYFVGGNMFIYYSSTQARNRDFRGPDFFVVLNVDGSKDRQGWVVWEEDGRYPDVIIELMSPSTAEVDTGIKKEIYEQIFRTPDYYVFDPFDSNSLQGWHLDLSQGYQELTPNERGWLWCQRLGLWLGTWEGAIEGKPATWLRFYDQQNNLVLLPEEAAQQRAEVAEHRLETVQQQVACRQLLRLLTARFGEVPQEVIIRLQALDVEQLEDLAETILTVDSLAQFVSFLSRQNP
ncbi:MAG: Uma2 family endonuclease [Xenococcus sp. MO_188.B8]|nr:Uma2 family endonuclease [Xenococcus sp. MO_188.B8]